VRRVAHPARRFPLDLQSQSDRSSAGEALAREIDEDSPPSSVRSIVLLVEADRRLRRQLRAVLLDSHYRVIETATGTEALEQAPVYNPDLVLLGSSLPDMDGIDVTARLREWCIAPILVISSIDREQEKVAALDAGANDFVKSPPREGELLARIRVWLRTTQRPANSLSMVLEVGDLRLDLARCRASVGGRDVRLTPKQYRLFAEMMRNAGKVMTHERLLMAVWGPAYSKETQYVRVYMGQLRQKFERNPTQPRYFLTEAGVGYRLQTADSPAT
jgi:two-component system, OmpR family, KDP operon response regulator KdpE